MSLVAHDQVAASVSVSQVLPASCDLLPSTVLMFRLLSMPSKQCAVSAVVAWGVFPICDCSLTLTQGRFRTPLLRGCPNSAIDQFSKIEQLLSADLDNWLCNLYFQVLILNSCEQKLMFWHWVWISIDARGLFCSVWKYLSSQINWTINSF